MSKRKYMNRNVRVSLLALILLSFLPIASFAQDSVANRWQDTFNKYLRTPPNVSVEGLNKVLNDPSFSDEKIKLNILLALVNDYAQLRNTDSSYHCAQEANKLAIALKDSLQIGRSYLTMAWVNRDKGKVGKVLEYSLKAEEFAEVLNDKRLESIVANTLASVYYDLKDDSLQKHYLERAYTLEKELNNGVGSHITMSNLGYIYFKEGDHQKALELFDEALKLSRNDRRSFYHSHLLYNHIIDVYEKEKNYEKCIENCDSLVVVWKTLGDKTELIHIEMKRLFYQSLNGKKVDFNGKLKEFNTIDASQLPVDVRKNILYNKYRFNAHFEKYKASVDYLEQYRVLTDSLAGDDLRKQVAFYKEQFDAEKRENKISQLENEKELATLKDEKQQVQILFLVIGLMLTVGFIVFLFIIYSKLKKTKAELEDLNVVKDRFFAIISHDLRNSVTSFQGVGSVIQSHVKKERWERLVSLGDKLDNEANKLGAFLNNLLNWSMSQLQRVPYNPENIALKQKIDEVLSLMEAQIEAKKLSVELQVQDDHMVFADSEALSLVVRNLFSNAVKYSNEQSKIYIRSEIQQGVVNIHVEDEGMGMNETKVKTLFSPTAKGSEKGTKGEEGTGLGLVLVKEFLKINKGNIRVESQLGKGTIFSFELPVSKVG